MTLGFAVPMRSHKRHRFILFTMSHSLPDFKTFKQLAAMPPASGPVACRPCNTSKATMVTLIPMYRRLMSDSQTPVLAYRRLVGPDDRMAPSFLLESVIGGDRV